MKQIYKKYQVHKKDGSIFRIEYLNKIAHCLDTSGHEGSLKRQILPLILSLSLFLNPQPPQNLISNLTNNFFFFFTSHKLTFVLFFFYFKYWTKIVIDVTEPESWKVSLEVTWVNPLHKQSHLDKVRTTTTI